MEIRDRKYLLGYAGHFPVLAEKERSGKCISYHSLMFLLAILGNDMDKLWREPHPVTISQEQLSSKSANATAKEKPGWCSQRWGTPLLCDLECFSWVYWHRKWPNAVMLICFAARATLSLCSHTKTFPSVTLLGGCTAPTLEVCLGAPILFLTAVGDLPKRILDRNLEIFQIKKKQIMALDLLWLYSQKIMKAVLVFHCKRGEVSLTHLK